MVVTAAAASAAAAGCRRTNVTHRTAAFGGGVYAADQLGGFFQIFRPADGALSLRVKTRQKQFKISLTFITVITEYRHYLIPFVSTIRNTLFRPRLPVKCILKIFPRSSNCISCSGLLERAKRRNVPLLLAGFNAPGSNALSSLHSGRVKRLMRFFTAEHTNSIFSLRQ